MPERWSAFAETANMRIQPSVRIEFEFETPVDVGREHGSSGCRSMAMDETDSDLDDVATLDHLVECRLRRERPSMGW